MINQSNKYIINFKFSTSKIKDNKPGNGQIILLLWISLYGFKDNSIHHLMDNIGNNECIIENDTKYITWVYYRKWY